MPLFSPPTPKNENMKRYAYAEMPSVRFFCGSAHRHFIICKYRHFIRCILFPTSFIRKVNLQHPHPTRNVIVSCQEIESYRYIMLKILSYYIPLYCTLCLFLQCLCKTREKIKSMFCSVLFRSVLTKAYRHKGSILTSYWYFVEQNEMPEWNQIWNWAFQQAYLTGDQWTYDLTRIIFADFSACLFRKVHNWFHYLWK